MAKFSSNLVAKVRTHEAVRIEISRLYDAADGKLDRLAAIVDQHPDQETRIRELEKLVKALKREMEISLHKGRVIASEMHKDKPNEQIMGQALDRAIVIARRLETDLVKYNAALDEILAACGLAP